MDAHAILDVAMRTSRWCPETQSAIDAANGVVVCPGINARTAGRFELRFDGSRLPADFLRGSSRQYLV